MIGEECGHSTQYCNIFSLVLLTYERQFTKISVVPSGDYKKYFTSRVNGRVMNHVIAASQSSIGYVLFRGKPRCRKRERFLI